MNNAIAVLPEAFLLSNVDLAHSVFEASNDAIFLLDAYSGFTIDCNSRALELFEAQNKSQLVGIHGPHELYKKHFDTVEMMEAIQDIKTGKAIVGEFEFVTKKGKVFWGRRTGRKIESSGKLFLLVWISDISERKQSEIQLEYHKELLKTIFNESTDALFLLNIENRIIIDCNRYALKLFEATDKNDLIGIIGSTFYKKPLPLETALSARNTIEEGRVFTTQIEFITLKKNEFWGDLAIKKIVIGDETLQLVRINNITERKRAIDALLDSEQRLALTLWGTEISILDWNIETGYVYFHLNFCKMLGYEFDEMQNSINFLVSLTHFSDLPMMWEKTKPHFKQLINYVEVEFRMRAKNKEWKWILARGKVVDWKNEKRATRMVGTMMDITQRKNAEFALMESEKRLENLNLHLEQKVINRTTELEDTNRKLHAEIVGRSFAQEQLNETLTKLESVNYELEAFGYSVSHDLRSPVIRIEGYTNALLEDFKNQLDKKAINYLQRIQLSAKKMNDLIQDLLKLSRMTRNEIHKEPTNLSLIVQNILTDLQQNEPNRTITLDIQPDINAICDPSYIQIVLDNLLRNAWKFTRDTPNPTIQFGVIQQDNKNTYFIKDNGAGFDDKYANKLFGAFQRLHSENEYEGSGIGLAIVKRIIQKHNGEVSATSEIDNGATFYFTLPSE